MSDEALPTFESNGERWKAVVFLESDRSTWHMMRPEELCALVAALPELARLELLISMCARPTTGTLPSYVSEVLSEKLNEYIEKVKEADAENGKLHARLKRMKAERDELRATLAKPFRGAPDCPPDEPDDTEPLL